jgi:hypothetical protein
MRIPTLVIFLLATICQSVRAGGDYSSTYACTNGKIHFYASTPLENIEATSNKAICVLNTGTKKVVAKVQMTSFVFPNGLMQEHFNENYMESTKFPYGELDAVISGNIDFTVDGVYNVILKGSFQMHGVKVDREIPAKITVVNGKPASGSAAFDVKLVDHHIKIPTAVITKIAEVVKVDLNFVFEKYQ